MSVKRNRPARAKPFRVQFDLQADRAIGRTVELPDDADHLRLHGYGSFNGGALVLEGSRNGADFEPITEPLTEPGAAVVKTWRRYVRPRLTARCRNAHKPASRSKLPVVTVEQDVGRKRAIRYLQDEAPTGVQGERNETGYRVACRLKDLGVALETCLEAMPGYWQCEPPLDPDEIEHVIRSAYKYGNAPPGRCSAGSGF